MAAAALTACILLVPAAGCATGWDGKRVYTARWQPAWKARFRQATYMVGEPGGDGWAPHKERDQQVVWMHEASSSVIAVRSQCQEHGDSSLEQFTDHLRIDFTEWTILEQSSVPLIGREALRTHVRAKLDGVPVELELIVVKKSGCLFDLTLIAVPRAFSGHLPAFERVVAGFEYPVRRS